MNILSLLSLSLVWIAAGCATRTATIRQPIQSTDHQKPPLSITVEALLPRIAEVYWHSILKYDSDSEKVAVLYSVPVVDGNGSLTYLELFYVPDNGPASPEDRIYLGSRDGYAIDRISEEDHTITLHAREYQYPDCIANPTKHVNIVIKWGQDIIRVSTFYPDGSANKDIQQQTPNKK